MKTAHLVQANIAIKQHLKARATQRTTSRNLQRIRRDIFGKLVSARIQNNGGISGVW